MRISDWSSDVCSSDLLVVIGEALAVMTDAPDATVEADPAQRSRGLRRHRPERREGRPQRVVREQVQDVHEQQFLVLLLVVDADLDKPTDLLPPFAVDRKSVV